MESAARLRKGLGPLMLWGLGVGYVISGMYFGWNLGLEKGGSLGLACATVIVTIMYVAFTLSYAELTCALPSAGGVFTFASVAFGPRWGLLAGITQIIEFTCAPPAIAAAIGAYLHTFFPEISPLIFALGTYLVFTLINALGIKTAAAFELWITFIAVAELLFFAALTLPAFRWEHLTSNPLPHGLGGIFAALPFALWFFLGIEGIANVAEETFRPQRTMVLGFSSAMSTLLVLCALTFIAAVGVNGWESIVFDAHGNPSDSPLPLALSFVVGADSPYYHLLVGIGVFGLVASFHGLLLAAARASYELGRLNAPWLGTLHPRTQTPIAALIFNMGIGVLALLTGHTGEIIIVACFGALSLYVISMLAFFQLRRSHGSMHRPYRSPGFPWLPALALVLAAGIMLCMVGMYLLLFGVYLGLVGVFLGLFWARGDTQKVIRAR